MLYFAYGSNMSLNRLKRRVPSARSLGCHFLPKHKLTFHKLGKDGSAKCDITETQKQDSRVFGVLFEMDKCHLPNLDKAEGLGKGYRHNPIEAFDKHGRSYQALSYKALAVSENHLPFTWYHEHVLRGAIEHNLPQWYVEQHILGVETKPDPNLTRLLKETSVHFPV